MASSAPMPEAQVKAFVQRISGGKGGGPSPVEEAMAMAKEALQAGDHASAAGVYSQILQREPANVEAQAGLARAMIAKGDLAKARQALDRVAKENAGHAEIAAARTALDLAEQAAKAMAGAGKLRARLAQNADDHEARLELATALFGSGEREAAIDELLDLFKRDRQWNDQAARKQLVKFFEAMGGADPLTLSGRRRLSSLMFSSSSQEAGGASVQARSRCARLCRSFRCRASCCCRGASCRSTSSSPATWR